MKPLHRFQARLLEVLRVVPEGGFSLEQLREAIGASSKSQVVHHMRQLEGRGLLKKDPDNSEGFILFDLKTAEKPVVFLPLYALAACGKGRENSQHVIERLPVQAALIPGKVKNTYLVRAEGDSMEPRIHEGDIVVVEELQPSSRPVGQIVVCEVDHEAKIKRYSEFGNAVVLESLNKNYPAEIVDSKKTHFRLCGVVRGIIFSKL